MRFYFTFLVVVFATIHVFSHVDPIATTDGSMTLNQNFRGNFAMEFTFLGSTNVVFQDIGIEFFNVGDDDTSSLYLALYDQTTNTLIKYSDTSVSSIYNQTVFVNFFISLEGNKPYLLVYGSKNPLNDDQLNYFHPNSLPYSNQIMPLTIHQIYHDNQVIPTNTTSQAPFLSFGISSQTGIDFIADKIVKKFKSDPVAKEYHTVFQTKSTKLKVTSIGLSYLDVGPNLTAKMRLSIKNTTTNQVLFYLDTTVVNTHGKKIDFPANFLLDTSINYSIVYQNLDTNDTDNVLLVYEPSSLPYMDNLNLTQIQAFFKNFKADTVGIAFYMNYIIPKSTAGLNEFQETPCYLLKESNQFWTIDFPNVQKQMNDYALVGMDGRNYNSSITYMETGILIDKSRLSSGLYIVRCENICKQSLKLRISD